MEEFSYSTIKAWRSLLCRAIIKRIWVFTYEKSTVRQLSIKINNNNNT